MPNDKKCAICGNAFQPRTYRGVVCSEKCRIEWKKEYAAKLAENDYFKKYQRKHKDKINRRNNDRYSEKIGKVDGFLPAKKCMGCSTFFRPTHNVKKFCTPECGMAHRKNNSHKHTI